MKVAVIGAGASGLVAARRLTQHGHDVTVFEAGDCWGGHTRSVSLESEGVRGPIETGFLVFNQAACPRLTSLLAELDVPTQEIRLAYEICDARSDMILRGGSLRELLASPKNLAIPSFYRVVPDWIRFTRQARKLIRTQQRLPIKMLGEFLKDGAYGNAFVKQFVYPLAGAVCPVGQKKLDETPLASLLGFIHNHGLLNLTRGTSCRTLAGGSSEYLLRLTDQFRDRIHLNRPVVAVARHPDFVLLKFHERPRERFEQVVFAVHADIALRLLADPMRHEREVLGSFEYASQNVYIHRNDNMLKDTSHPSAIWRFQPSENGSGGAALSYCISEVQDVDAPKSLMLTMMGANQAPPADVIRTIHSRRPVFSAKSHLAQRRFRQLNSWSRTSFCGAYWGHGFHEDSVRTAEVVAERITRMARHSLTVNG